MDKIHIKIQNSDIPVFTIWGDSDQVVVYKDFEKRIDSILPKRKEFFIDEYLKGQKEEMDLSEHLKKTYGEGTINLDTDEFIPKEK